MLYLRSGLERVLTTRQREFSVVIGGGKVAKEKNTVMMRLRSVFVSLRGVKNKTRELEEALKDLQPLPPHRGGN